MSEESLLSCHTQAPIAVSFTLSLLFLFLLLWSSAVFPADRQARTLNLDNHTVGEIRCLVKVSTVIVLPVGEKILDATTGDKDFWPTGGAENVAYVKPAKPNSRTNLNLITASGNVYSFALTEVSRPVKEGAASSILTPPDDVDYKVFVQPIGDAAKPITQAPRFVSSDELADAQKELKRVQDELEKTEATAKERERKQVEAFKSGYPKAMVFDYKFRPNTKPFFIKAIYHDSEFTYIKSDAKEKPALYEIKDDKPNLINFQLEQGVYIVPKVVDRGYLAVGKEKTEFWRVQ